MYLTLIFLILINFIFLGCLIWIWVELGRLRSTLQQADITLQHNGKSVHLEGSIQERAPKRLRARPFPGRSGEKETYANPSRPTR